jgi:hypothetical protein
LLGFGGNGYSRERHNHSNQFAIRGPKDLIDLMEALVLDRRRPVVDGERQEIDALARRVRGSQHVRDLFDGQRWTSGFARYAARAVALAAAPVLTRLARAGAARATGVGDRARYDLVGGSTTGAARAAAPR